MNFKLLALVVLASASVFAHAEKHHKETGNKPSTYRSSRNDNDWTIAKKMGTSPKQVRLANPDVDFRRLAPGTILHIPGSVTASRKVASKPAKKSSKVVAEKKQTKSSITSSKGIYVMTAEDNDWTIAHRYGVKVKDIRALNPDIEWNRVRPGRKVNVPGKSGSSSSRVASKQLKKISTRYAQLVGSNVNVRSKPDADSRRAAKVDMGRTVAILDHQSGWYKVKFTGGTSGWVRSDFLVPSKTGGKEWRKAIRQREQEEDRVASLRKRREQDEERVAARTRRHREEVATKRPERKHTDTRVAANKPSAAKVESDSGLRGGTSRSSLLNKADSFRGVKYRYGGMSRSATDCSGFTSQVFRSQGVTLPRTAHEQAHVGKSVSRDSLKPGDLVFFKTRGSRGGVSHVGIYKGDGKFIHASSGAGHVKVSSLGEGYYSSRFAGAKRVMKVSEGKKKSDRGE